MPIERMPLQPVRVDYGCDVCGEGHMRPMGTRFMGDMRFPHRCDKCGAPGSFDEAYPVVRYEPIAPVGTDCQTGEAS